MMTLTYQDTNEGKCKKCGRELEHLRGVSTGSTYCECRWCGYARLKATNAELLEALRLCECELSMYSMLASQSNNPQAWQDAIDAAREAIRKASR